MKNINVATRLITILQYLNKGLTINVEELSDEFDISIRQVQNDIKLFSTFFEIERLGRQNYKLKKAYQLINVDNESIQIALGLLKSLQHNALPQMNTLMDQILPDSHKYHKIFHFQLDYEIIHNIQIFYDVLKAVSNLQSSHFIYTKKDGTSKEVFIHPYKIANFSNYWYILAYDVKDERLKSYHINSITHFKIDEENFISDIKIEKEIDALCTKADSPWFSDEKYSVTLEVSGEARYYLKRNLPHNLELITQKSEKDLYKFHYYDDEREVFIFIKQWLPDVKIIDNLTLQNKFSKILTNYLQSI